ncbi:MAG: hypothetical protein PHH77_00765 [Victivallaceae bacterium]|nr:hypothetical protein [Victivallaceae bacterium]
MTLRRKYSILRYTLVEVMVAMGIFLILMTIMMQFFTSAQGLWSLSSKRNQLYADARVAMNLMTKELQTMLYRNDTTDGSGIYPFWYEWTDDIDSDFDLGLSSGIRPPVIKTHFAANNDLPVNGSTPYLTALNFIAATDLPPVDAKGSNTCEIRYIFIPIYFDGSGFGLNNVRGGYLKRSCIGEYYDSTTLTNDQYPSNTPYNFYTYYYRGIYTALSSPYNIRVVNIWSNNSTDDLTYFSTVINGVYSLRFTCYRWDDSSGLIELDPMNRTAPGKKPDGSGGTSDITTYPAYDTAMGTPVPVAIRIDMKLMAPEDLKKLALAIYKSDTDQIRVLKQKMRTFSKVIYLGMRNKN